LHGLDCRELELVGQVHALLCNWRLGLPMPCAIRGLRRSYCWSRQPFQIKADAREWWRGGGAQSLVACMDHAGVLMIGRVCVRGCCGVAGPVSGPVIPGEHEPTVFRLAKEANNVKGGRRNSST
jgi:hypothetical protein